MDETGKDTELTFFTTNEVAEMLRMNVQVIARKLQNGELPGYKIGKDWRVKEADLFAWLNRHSNQNQLSPRDQVIERFMNRGRFDVLPAQQKRRRYIIEYMLQQFELNRIYTEKEVNDIITRYHDDYCRVRREFIDSKMMNRKNGKYRRVVSYTMTK